MSKRKTDVIEELGERLARLRKAFDYTQVAFAAEMNTTRCVVADGEALAAQVSGDGAKVRLVTDSLKRRLLVIEEIDPHGQAPITRLLDTLIERDNLKQSVNEGA